MKRMLAAVLVILCVVSLASCTGKKTDAAGTTDPIGSSTEAEKSAGTERSATETDSSPESTAQETENTPAESDDEYSKNY